MASIWDKPPTDEELGGADAWAAPPTPQELEVDADPVDMAPVAPTRRAQVVDISPKSALEKELFILEQEKRRRDSGVEQFVSAEKGQGAPLAQRAVASLPLTERGKFDYLVSEYGQGNVKRAFDERAGVDAWLVRDNGEGQWRTFDEYGFTSGDLADVAGPALETAPGMFVRAPLVGAAADAIGSGARQALATTVAGEQLTPEERLTAAAIAAGSGLVGQGIAKAGKKLLAPISPTRVAGRVLQSAGAKEGGGTAAQVAARRSLSRQTGVDITSGQALGSREALHFEDMVRRSPGGRDVLQGFDERQAGQFKKFVQGIVRNAAGGNVKPEKAGARVAAAYRGHVERLAKARSALAGQYFDQARQAGGKAQVVGTDTLFSTIDSISENIGKTPIGDEASRISRAVAQWKTGIKAAAEDARVADLAEQHGLHPSLIDRSSLEAGPIGLDVNTAQRTMELLGRASRGKAELIEGLNPSYSRKVARQLLDAMRTDLEQAAAGEGQGAVAAKKLLDARSVYSKLATEVEQAQNSALDDILKVEAKKGGESAAESLLRANPSRMRLAMSALGRIDPEAAEQMRGLGLAELLEKAIVRGAEGAGSKGMADLSPAKFVSVAIKNRAKVRALLDGDKKALKAWNKALALARIASKRGMEGASPTAPLLWEREFWSGMLHVAMHPFKSAREASLYVAAKRFARAFTDPDSRDIMLGMMKPKGPSRSVRNLAKGVTQINAILDRRDSLAGGLEAIPEEEQLKDQAGNIYTIEVEQ